MDMNQNTKVVEGTSDPPSPGPPINPMVFDLAEEIQGEVKKLKHENKAMTHWCNIMERENKILKNRLNDIKNKLLENNIVMHDVEESFEESESQRKIKVKAMISHTVNRSTVAERMEVVENTPIEWTERLGRYNASQFLSNL